MCSVGLERLAHLLVAYSLGASAASLLGLLGLWLPRSVPLVAGAGVHLLLTLSLFFWAPTPRVLRHIWILYVAAVLWGVGSALNKTGLSSEYSHGHWDGWAGDPVTASGWLRRNTEIPGTDMGSHGYTRGLLWWRWVSIPVDTPRSGRKFHGLQGQMRRAVDAPGAGMGVARHGHPVDTPGWAWGPVATGGGGG